MLPFLSWWRLLHMLKWLRTLAGNGALREWTSDLWFYIRVQSFSSFLRSKLMNAALKGGGFAFLSQLNPRFKRKAATFSRVGQKSGFLRQRQQFVWNKWAVERGCRDSSRFKSQYFTCNQWFFFTRAANAITTQTFLHLGKRSTTQVKIKKES